MTNAINPSSPQPSTVGTEASFTDKPGAAIPRQESAAQGKSLQSADATESFEALEKATRNIADYIQTVSRSLQISVDSELGDTVITVVDSDTDEVIRQIPAEEALEVARYLSSADDPRSGESPVLGLLINRDG